MKGSKTINESEWCILETNQIGAFKSDRNAPDESWVIPPFSASINPASDARWKKYANAKISPLIISFVLSILFLLILSIIIVALNWKVCWLESARLELNRWQSIYLIEWIDEMSVSIKTCRDRVSPKMFHWNKVCIGLLLLLRQEQIFWTIILSCKVYKRGCVFPMVIWLAFRVGQYRANDHPYHAPQFTV